jgi:elongation factor G
LATELDKIKSFALLGHGGVGKTSLGEAMLFAAGITTRLGRVDDGSSVLDFEPEEVRRKITLSASLHHLAWKRYELTLIDTPGYANFLPDTINCMRGVQSAIFVVSPKDVAKVEMEKLWARANELSLSRLVFVNRLDREPPILEKALEDIRKNMGGKPIPLTIPIGADDTLQGIVNLLTMKRLIREGQKNVEKNISPDVLGSAEKARSQLLESIAETDDSLLERYLNGEDVSSEDWGNAMRRATLKGDIIPVFCGSALQGIGVADLLDGIVEYLPSPPDVGNAAGMNPVLSEEAARSPDPSSPFSAYVFKTVIDPFAGKLSIARIHSGTLTPDSSVYNPNRKVKEKIGQVFRLEGKKQRPLSQAGPGEIVAFPKLKETVSGDTLCDERAPIVFPGLVDFHPVISFALEPKTKADEEKISHGLSKITEEDPTVKTTRDPQTKEFILSGIGQDHLEVSVEKLKRKYGVDIELKAPKVPYKETIKGSASAQGKYKRQSGGRGQYGDTWITVEPLPRGTGFEFVDQIVGGAIPRNYIPAVAKGVQEAMLEGHLAGFPMVDIRVTLYDGSYHEVDSSDMAFRIAGSMGFKNAVAQSKPVILEPIMTLEIAVPDECTGDVIGDLNSRRGKVLGMEVKSNNPVIKAHVPMSESLKYAPDLRSMTSGRGTFHIEFYRYEELPAHLTEKVVKEARENKEKERE